MAPSGASRAARKGKDACWAANCTRSVCRAGECGSSLLRQRLGLAAVRRAVKVLAVELLEPPHLRGGEVDLRRHDDVGEVVGVAQRGSRAASSSRLASRRSSTLPRAHSLRQVALDGGQAPAVGLALETRDQRLQRRAQPAALVGLDVGQQLALGLAQVGAVVAVERAVGPQIAADVGFGCRRCRAACRGWDRCAPAGRRSRSRCAPRGSVPPMSSSWPSTTSVACVASSTSSARRRAWRWAFCACFSIRMRRTDSTCAVVRFWRMYLSVRL